jgi:hypothetical protein
MNSSDVDLLQSQKMNNDHKTEEAAAPNATIVDDDATFKPIDSPYQQLLECPFCDGTYHHVARVGTELSPEGDELEVYEGTSLVFERKSSNRRSAVRIDFVGECGHYWSLILQQHKGVMRVYARERETPPCPPEEVGEIHYPGSRRFNPPVNKSRSPHPAPAADQSYPTPRTDALAHLPQ